MPKPYLYGTNEGKRRRDRVLEFMSETMIDTYGWVDHDKLVRDGEDAPIWVYKETLSNANVNGGLFDLFCFIRKNRRKVIMVGPDRLLKVSNMIDCHHIGVRDTDAWRHVWSTVGLIEGLVRDEQRVVLFSAGFATNLMIYDLFDRCPNATMLDMGAIFDPYSGHNSRKGYRKESFKASKALHLRAFE